MEPGTFGEKLAQQPIGILISAALPGRMGMGKIDTHLGLLRKQAMLPHLGAVVIRE